MRLTKPLKILMAVAGTLLGLLALIIIGLALGWARAPAEKLASHFLERPVKLDGLYVYVVRATPYAKVEGLQIANAPWVSGTTVSRSVPQMVDLGSGEIAVRILPLLQGQLRIAKLELNNANIDLLREVSGRANWALGASKKEEGASPLQLPMIERFVVADSSLKLVDDVSKIRFEGNFATEEGTHTDAGQQPLTLTGRGELNGQPFALDLTGGAVAQALGRGAYPFKLEVKHGATRITADGQFNDLLSLGDFTADMSLAGRNLADLYYLTGLSLPSTRDYSLRGKLSRQGMVYELNALNGRLGASDLAGDVRVDTSGERVVLWADLKSRLLDPADAGVIFGGEAESKYLLPDNNLDLTRLRGMDAEVRYKAEAINVDTLPLKQVDLTMTLDHGRLTMQPLAVTLPQGTVSGSLVIDGSRDVPQVAVDVRLTGGRMEDFAAPAGQREAIEGPLVARVKLAGSGWSFHDAAGNSNGMAAVVIPRGNIRQAFAELLGVNAVRGLGLLLTGDQRETPIRCGVASFEGKNGLYTAQHVVVDTGVVQLTGQGQLNFKDESMDLTVQGKPKELRLMRLLVPLHVGGTLKSPDVGINPIPTGMQTGAAVALGIALTPLAAVLPFVDPGLAEDANCTALIGEAKAAGVRTTLPK